MDEKTEKKGLFKRLIKTKTVKKSPCCGGFVVEEIPEKESGQKGPSDQPKPKKGSCCG